jgi:hypothetical protein
MLLIGARRQRRKGETPVFFTLLIIVSIVTLLLFIRFERIKNETVRSLMPAVSFVFSWVVTVMMLTAVVETWQLVLSIPPAVRAPVPAWGQVIESGLHTAVYLLPVGRMALAGVYALPLLLIPLLVIAMKGLEVEPVLLCSAVVNLSFFWLLLLMDNGLPESAVRIPIQGLILLVAYALALFLLIRQRPFVAASAC